MLAAVSLLGADLALAALALAELQPPAGRGARQTLDVPGGTALLIDESYNANPASMRAALALLGQVPMGPRGRRIAVLGDMLELGAHGSELHRALVEPVLANDIDLVFCCRPADARRCGRLFRRSAAAAMPRPLPRSNRQCSAISMPATPSW